MLVASALDRGRESFARHAWGMPSPSCRPRIVRQRPSWMTSSDVVGHELTGGCQEALAMLSVPVAASVGAAVVLRTPDEVRS
jgi:hypothetical protein